MTVRLTSRLARSMALGALLVSAATISAYAEGGAPAVDPLDALLQEAQGGGAPAADAAPADAAPAVAAAAGAMPDDLEAAAHDILDRHCARCHQDGKLVGQSKPSKDFGYILDFDKLKANPKYIRPGKPEQSEIMVQITGRNMPYDYYIYFDQAKGAPSEDEVKILYAWIAKLGEQSANACAEVTPIAPEEMVRYMADDIVNVERTRIATTRYLTLTNLYNACTPEDEMEVYRQATVKLLNSLSHVSDVVRMETIDPKKTIIRFNLKDVGWTEDDWSSVLAATRVDTIDAKPGYPYAVQPDTPYFTQLAGMALTDLPYVRADWFAYTASRPPLYDKLLRLGEDFNELQKDLGIDVNANIERFIAKRAGFQKSGVSVSNRLIERHPISTGYFWTSYDFAASHGDQELFENPLGPGEGEFSFKHDGGETIYSLPNGFQAYYLNTADGKRLDKGPQTIVLDRTRRDLAVTNGISCIGCHNNGMRLDGVDEIRDYVMSNKNMPSSVSDAVEALYPTKEEMNRILLDDLRKFQDAMLRAGLGIRDENGNVMRDPETGYYAFPGIAGVEMVNALSKRYEDAVSLELAAAEFGVPAKEFLNYLYRAGGIGSRLAGRLEHNLVPRDKIEEDYLQIVELVSDLRIVSLDGLIKDVGVTPAAPVKQAVEDSGTFDLSLVANAPSYHVGDLPVFTVTSDHDCYLTLVNIDSYGTVTVLFPNKFQQDNFIKAGVDFHFPSAESGFQFRFADPGVETVNAACSIDAGAVDNVKVDFKQDFTKVGTTAEYLVTRAIKVEAAGGGGPPAKAAPPVKVGEVVVPVKPDAKGVVAHTSIQLPVK